MSVSLRRFLFLVLALGIAVSAAAMPGGNGPFNNDPGDPGQGGSCSYCNQARCGCDSPPLGYRLDYSCSCGSPTCSRTCEYTAI